MPHTAETALPAPLGRLLMIGLPGLSLDSSTARLIERYQINNFILFKRNIVDPEQLRHLCLQLRRLCRQNNLQSPLIAIDQEGGSVARLGPPFTRFDDARIMAAAGNAEEELRRFARITATELLDVGINCNLAPVLDVCPAGEEYFMIRRSLGSDPEQAGRLGVLVIKEMQEQGVAACGKHFPGLGGATLDPHYLLPVISRTTAQAAADLIPFRMAVEAGVAGIMTSHAVYDDLEPGQPATLSAKILSGLLRQELGFQGVIITDDLEMGAVENEQPVADAAATAFHAGSDLLLVCHDHDKVVRILKTLEGLVENGAILPARLRASARRIEKMQLDFALP